MRVSEWVALGYFGYLAVAALASPLSPPRRARVVAECTGSAAVVVAIAAWSRARPLEAWLLHVRDWVPVIYLLWFYWIPAHFSSTTNPRAEQRLVEWDRRWAAPLVDAVVAAPRACAELLELAYLFCYPLLPAGLLFTMWWSAGADVDRYWTSVLLSGALSYGVLPWLRTRPPRHLEPDASVPASSVRLFNEAVLHRASVQLNTFPSGHVATSFAAAFAVVAQVGAPGLPFVALACAIAVACVVGRYHYLADAVLGVAVAAIAFLAARFV